MRGDFIVLALLAMGPSLTALAQAPAVPATTASAAQTLAKHYLPTDLVKETGTREFDKNFDASFDGAAGNSAMEAQFPGLKAAGKRAGLAVLNAAYDRDLPNMQNALALYLEQQFSSSELTKLNDFYGSATGQKLMRSMLAGADTTKLAERAKANPDAFQMQAADVQGLMNPAALAQLSQAELASIMQFGISPIGRKFGQHSSALQKICVDGTNALIRNTMPVVQSKVIEAVSAHIASFGKGQK
ncbi:DUF2059 domain-containing protein [Sphingobium terrigena]|uniref:DUF2059 domain-containing protein n=1 Tax=Sphingobium terrigena TaxID=2304063 RepID=A0A418YXV4_9SPHN|nr:DUF2059 domain-containing protein [Sphingobium terrigena]RJG57686.1 DUF2059 domain-containing protein [Sphingobium terrigena]